LKSEIPQNLLLFDGVCHLCEGVVGFLLPRDPAGRLHYGSIQSALGSRLYREHGLDPERPDTLLLLTPHGAFRRSDAVLEIARLLGGAWRLLLLLKVVPRTLRDAAYDALARRRYRWFGRAPACLLPRPEWRDRFVEGTFPACAPPAAD
jgi:predicted DCC family thiol-disulfide oxidoreductase YuxK